MIDQIFNNPEIYSGRINSCPLCSSNQIDNYYIINKYKLPFNTDRCKNCEFIFMNPRFNQKTIKSFYKKEYYSGKNDYSYHDEREIKKFSKYIWDKRISIINSFIKGGNFLDVGCSFGGLLESSKKYFKPYGIEISNYACNYLKNDPDITIHNGTFKNHSFKDNFFSVITMIELIEHLEDPASSIKESFRLLKDDGLLVIQTANMEGLQAKLFKERYSYFMPGHLSYFTKRSLVEILKQTGFKKVKVFYPVEFGLLPKLKKSRHSYKSILDYKSWIRITLYHLRFFINSLCPGIAQYYCGIPVQYFNAFT